MALPLNNPFKGLVVNVGVAGVVLVCFSTREVIKTRGVNAGVNYYPREYTPETTPATPLGTPLQPFWGWSYMHPPCLKKGWPLFKIWLSSRLVEEQPRKPYTQGATQSYIPLSGLEDWGFI